jgi:hypothetical protein
MEAKGGRCRPAPALRCCVQRLVQQEQHPSGNPALAERSPRKAQEWDGGQSGAAVVRDYPTMLPGPWSRARSLVRVLGL